MAENPFSPPTFIDKRNTGRSLLCNVMFWLSAMLGIFVAAVAISMGYANANFAFQNDFQLPTYVICVTLLAGFSAVTLFFAAYQWRTHRIWTGLLSMLFAGIMIFGGPRLLLMLLMQ